MTVRLLEHYTLGDEVVAYIATKKIITQNIQSVAVIFELGRAMCMLMAYSEAHCNEDKETVTVSRIFPNWTFKSQT